ncbi:MAG: GNAT family N-acetyltransferase [Chthoniobacteraceae bacterium]
MLPALEQIARERRWKHLELRGQGIVPADTPAAVTFYAHRLDLRGGTDAVASRFRPSVRQAQRKAERHGLTVTLERSQGAMRAFYRLHLLTRKRHGMPTQPWKFFNHIQTEMLVSGLGFIALAKLGVQPVAAAVFFHFGRTGLYKYGASDAQVQEQRPNQLAMAAGISHLVELGIETLHFGRTSFANEGLRRFKQSWGATEELLSYYRLNLRSQRWETARDRSEGLHTRIFRHLPIGLNRLAGQLLYPHLD